MLIYILCVIGGLVVILVHRKCPAAFKNMDLFADKHVLEDTHALRTLDTKLGASFSVALMFVVCAVLAFVSDPSNNFIKTSGLEPGTQSLLPFAGAPALDRRQESSQQSSRLRALQASALQLVA